MLKFNVMNVTPEGIEVEVWQVFETLEEIPAEHPGQQVKGKPGNYWLHPKRAMVISDETKDFKVCCEGSRMTGKQILDSQTTVEEEQDVTVEEEQQVTETRLREKEVWDGKAYRIETEEYQATVYDEYPVKDSKGKIVRKKKVPRTEQVTRTEKQKVPVTMTVREAAAQRAAK